MSNKVLFGQALDMTEAEIAVTLFAWGDGYAVTAMLKFDDDVLYAGETQFIDALEEEAIAEAASASTAAIVKWLDGLPDDDSNDD